MNTIEILMAEVQRLRALLHDQNTTIGQTLAAAMSCYPHAPDEHGNEDPTAPYVVEPAIAEDVAARAAEMIAELRLTLAAEQGRQEGAPSEGWRYVAAYFERWEKGKAVVQNLGGEWKWRVGRRKFRPAPTARAAMQAADAAQGPR